jgi:methylmalonyl-CoA mutase cobalamin-binding domain/chain
MESEILTKISEALQKGKAKDVKVMVQEALGNGISAEKILNEGLLYGMGLLGVRFKNNEVYVPDVLIAARAMKAGSEILKPQLAADGVKASGRVIIGTVKGDLHDIGKNLVAMMMEGKGLEVTDIGVDVAPEKFIEAAIEKDAQIICCSALLTTTMGELKPIIDAAVAAGIRDKVIFMVGGAPVNDNYAKSIGADIYRPDAATAAEAAAEAILALKA